MITSNNSNKSSNVVKLVGAQTGISIQSLINPFVTDIKFDIISAYDREAFVELLDHSGKKLKSQEAFLRKGVNRIMMNNTGNLIAGFYILQIRSGNVVIHRKLIKNKMN